MYRYFTAKNTLNFVPVLQALVKGYNRSYHRSIKMAPEKVTEANSPEVSYSVWENANETQETYNHGQKSWDKFRFVALFQTRQTNSHGRSNSSTLGQPLPPSPPPTMLDTCTRYFSRVSTLYGGGGGGKATQFKTDNNAFWNLRFENTEN